MHIAHAAYGSMAFSQEKQYQIKNAGIQARSIHRQRNGNYSMIEKIRNIQSIGRKLRSLLLQELFLFRQNGGIL